MARGREGLDYGSVQSETEIRLSEFDVLDGRISRVRGVFIQRLHAL
jgi:hypothetical protein